MPHGSVLRIEPVKAGRDDSSFECIADNAIGEAATATATLEVYQGQGMCISCCILPMQLHVISDHSIPVNTGRKIYVEYTFIISYLIVL